jgi:hypothetical protein
VLLVVDFCCVWCCIVLYCIALYCVCGMVLVCQTDTGHDEMGQDGDRIKLNSIKSNRKDRIG